MGIQFSRSAVPNASMAIESFAKRSVERLIISLLTKFFSKSISVFRKGERPHPASGNLCAACKVRICDPICRRRRRRRIFKRRKRIRRRYAGRLPRIMGAPFSNLLVNPSDRPTYNRFNSIFWTGHTGSGHERRRQCCCPCHLAPELPPLPDSLANDGNISYIS